MNMVKNKYRSTPNEHLHQCLRLAVTPFMPKFKPQKSVTFHTNKARPHNHLCIVQTFLLELCFSILTVTVPDPDLNVNLASGPFGFLIEYPCSRTFYPPTTKSKFIRMMRSSRETKCTKMTPEMLELVHK